MFSRSSAALDVPSTRVGCGAAVGRCPRVWLVWDQGGSGSWRRGQWLSQVALAGVAGPRQTGVAAGRVSRVRLRNWRVVRL